MRSPFRLSLLLLFSLFAATAVPGGAAAGSAGEDSGDGAAAFLRVGYLNTPIDAGGWDGFAQLFDGTYTHLVLTFALPARDGGLTPADALRSFTDRHLRRARAAGTRVLVSIGGATVPFATYVEIARSPAARARFVRATLELIERPASGGYGDGGYDGVDLNFEGWNSEIDVEARRAVDELALEVARAVKRLGRERVVSVALPPSYWLPLGFSSRVVASDDVDLAFHMSYDFFRGVPGSANGPFRAPGAECWLHQAAAPIERSVRGALGYLEAQGYPKRKLLGGLPFFTTAEEPWARVRDERDWDAVELHADYLEKATGRDGARRWVNDAAAVEAKVRGFRSFGLAGVVVWQVGHEGTRADLSRALARAAKAR